MSLTEHNQNPKRPANCSRRRLAVGLACLQLIFCGCGGEPKQADAGKEPSTVSFLTFNTALIAQTENLDQRLDAIINGIPNTNADVVCLQELWLIENLTRAASMLSEVYPYAHWSVSEGEAVASCSALDSESLLGCLMDACSDVESSQMALCAISNCANAFTQVSTTCQNCVLNHQTLPPEEIASTCESPVDNTPVYKDQSGILLLSKYPFKSKDYLRLESSFGDRGVLTASIESEVLSSADVYCTHLVATQTTIDYPGMYGSWNGERAVQIDSLGKFIADKRGDADSVVVMGDLNCGPDGDTVTGEDPQGFAQLIDSGLNADYVSNHDFECTFCADNPLVSSGTPSVMIDHVLFSNLPEDVSQKTKRVFVEPITIQVNGEAVITARSDHYGFQSTLESEN